MEVKVYQMTPEDKVATKWSLEETIEWYEKTYGHELDEEDINNIHECNLDRKDIWVELTNEELDEYEEDYEMCPFPYDGVQRSLNEILNENDDFWEPFIIASTEY